MVLTSSVSIRCVLSKQQNLTCFRLGRAEEEISRGSQGIPRIPQGHRSRTKRPLQIRPKRLPRPTAGPRILREPDGQSPPEQEGARRKANPVLRRRLQETHARKRLPRSPRRGQRICVLRPAATHHRERPDHARWPADRGRRHRLRNRLRPLL